MFLRGSVWQDDSSWNRFSLYFGNQRLLFQCGARGLETSCSFFNILKVSSISCYLIRNFLLDQKGLNGIKSCQMPIILTYACKKLRRLLFWATHTIVEDRDQILPGSRLHDIRNNSTIELKCSRHHATPFEVSVLNSYFLTCIGCIFEWWMRWFMNVIG